MDFYDLLANEYDRMISFDERLPEEIGIFRNILHRFPAERILDAGCGSGFHSIVLSTLGSTVVGIDRSEKMLDCARLNAGRYDAPVEFIRSDFLSLGRGELGIFDAIYCLGNSFAHLLDLRQRRKAIQNFKNVLVPGGYVFLQILNYDKILKEKPEVFSVKEADHRRYFRMYRYHRSLITFTIRIESEQEYREFSQKLYPLQSAELSHLAKTGGFSGFGLYGNLNLQKYKRYGSDNICAVLAN